MSKPDEFSERMRAEYQRGYEAGEAAASPAAPAVDPLDLERMEAALMGVWRRMQRGDMSAGGPNGLDMRHLWAAAVIEHYVSQDTVDQVAGAG